MVNKLFDGNFILEHKWNDIIDEKNDKYNKLSIDEKRDLYHNQSVMKKKFERNDKGLTEEEKDFLIWGNMDEFQCSKEEYIERCKNKALTTFAVVKDGKWYERGNMGWWGCVSDEKDGDEWSKEFNNLIKDLPDDTLLTLVDCHI